MLEAFINEQAFFESLAAASRISAEQRSAAQEEAADSMEGVIHFLDDVARRLQLLALNGNIIAAQAGEYGRAFRVVCRELGILADRAKSTVTDVRKLMHTMGLEATDAHALGESPDSTPRNETASAVTSGGGDSRGRAERPGGARTTTGTGRGGPE
jgi:methyl-accepting chemotaxis protein